MSWVYTTEGKYVNVGQLRKIETKETNAPGEEAWTTIAAEYSDGAGVLLATISLREQRHGAVNRVFESLISAMNDTAAGTLDLQQAISGSEGSYAPHVPR